MSESQQPRLANTQDAISYLFTAFQNINADMPEWGSTGRIAKLRAFVRSEPILAGAHASMVSKAQSLDFQVVGGRNRARHWQTLLNEAEDGVGWDSVLSRWTQDYLGTDTGGILELARAGKYGPVTGIYHMDAECVGLTGNVKYPLVYAPKVAGEKISKKDGIRLAPQDFVRIVDMPSSDESKFGMGFCAVSRAYKAARVLLALYNYDEEKLADMPMPGLVSVTGLTMSELEAAFALYNAHRQSSNQTTFKALLWLASQTSALQQINANLVSFAGLPENFDREQTYSLYIYSLALDYGVDAREFWPATQSGATKGEAEVQAQKAKGKGFGQMLSNIEHSLNWKVLPRGIEFAFDRRNDDDDLAREILRGQVISNIRKLWEPPIGFAEGLINTEEARRLLVSLQSLPDWIQPTEDVTLHSLDKELDDASSDGVPGHLEKIAKEEVDKAIDTKMGEKAARAGLDRGEDLIAINRAGDSVTLWSSRKQFTMPANLLSLPNANKSAAIAHLQAAGLLISDN